MAFRRLLVCLWLSCAAFAAPGEGGRRVVVEPAVPLTATDRTELAAKGLTLGRAIAGGKYLARLKGDLHDARIKSIESLGHAMKIHGTAIREALRGNATAELAVFFHDDVPLDDARGAVMEAGGALQDALPVSFERSRRLVVYLPGHALEKLARDERVLTITSAAERPKTTHNAKAASLTHVTELQTITYGLTGAGVTMSMGEIGEGQTSHQDLAGRFFSNVTGGTTDQMKHATHVAGTMIGSGGGSASAKGMAPGATLRIFPIHHWQDTKLYDLAPAGVTIDNNSWGYALGWRPGGTYWIFQNDDEYFGAYDLYYTAPLDDVTRVHDILIVVSAGNEAQNPKLPANGAHHHAGDETTVWCTSGCTALPCSGPAYCEAPHMPNVPYGTVGDMGSAKNIITVGATGPTNNIEPYSSRGPTRDGRVKPDLVAPGRELFSTVLSNGYGTMSGTSMAAPVVSGIAALLTEQWRITFAGAKPTPAQLKTVMIATAEDLGHAGPDYTHGFGLVNAKAAVDRVRADGGAGMHIRTASIVQGQTYSVDVQVEAGQTLRAVLGWTDPEVLYTGSQVAEKALVNDLDLSVVYSTDGTTFLPYVPLPETPYAAAVRGVNTRDNTEVVELTAPQAGTYRVVVKATSIKNFSVQQFVLVTNARIASPVLLNATATSQSSVSLTWTAPAPGAIYDVTRRSAGGAIVTLATGLTGTTYVDNSVSANTAYVYAITAYVGGSTPIGSNPDSAVTFALANFTGTIKLAEIFELRNALNALRGVALLPQFSWSIAPVAGGPVRAAHIHELRTSLAQARSALALPTVTWAPGTLTTGASVIRSSDFTQIRDALR